MQESVSRSIEGVSVMLTLPLLLQTVPTRTHTWKWGHPAIRDKHFLSMHRAKLSSLMSTHDDVFQNTPSSPFNTPHARIKAIIIIKVCDKYLAVRERKKWEVTLG